MYKFVYVVSVVLKFQIKWHEGSDLIEVMARFKELCGLLLIHGTINVTLINLKKPRGEIFVANDYYSFKYKGYNIQMQEVVNHHRRFYDIFVSIFKLMNNVRVLWISFLYNWEIDGNIFTIEHK
jgi:hypothetical protein